MELQFMYKGKVLRSVEGVVGSSCGDDSFEYGIVGEDGKLENVTYPIKNGIVINGFDNEKYDDIILSMKQTSLLRMGDKKNES